MSIIEDTSIDQSTFECDDQFLNFPPFEKIGNGTLNTHFLTDAVGQVSNLSDVQTVQVAGNDKKKVEFRLMDINMPNDEFALALTATKKDKRPIKDLIDDWNDVGIISISEIITATQEEDCKIICSIESIDTDWSWFIFGHVSRNRCNKRCMRIKSKGGGNLAPNEKPIFWCTTCRVNTTTVTPQFKLHLTVKDDTSTCKLMLLDFVAKVVVGFEAKDIRDGSYEEIEDPDILPQAITDLILQLESNSEPITHVSSGSSIMSGGEVSIREKNEASSSEGSSTPFSKRKG
ncbi:uncharacterized protein LOC111205782 [Brassica napus]|uniref:(rape) hypothetical protein n=1 Tax=Brassica napus TaxID=3708 RepID=A0A816JGK0_BRANA|nr:PREDICTED: uncharacterized protein LOC106338973 [Brassica oleracea var. oleracea]XP_022557717.1 uncharacterized protein LOC111205782 [Brassica napus]CAF1862842.1 unnamed protein product [Brassica napus]